MTIGEAIEKANHLEPNAYPDYVKVGWLSSLDGQIFEEVLKTHENCPIESFVPYDQENTVTELLVPWPYAEEIYVNYLEMQIAKENGEAGRYNRAAAHYNNAFEIYKSWYNRTHMPLTGGRGRFLF